MRATITEAFREMRTLLDTNAGRLRGLPVRYIHHDLPQLPGAAQRWHTSIQAAIADRAQRLTGDSPEYLVISDDTVVLILTAGAHLRYPDINLTALQTKHQHRAAAVLSDLPRHILTDLADRLAATHGHDTTPVPAAGDFRIAPADHPTRTQWFSDGTNPKTVRTPIRGVGIDPDHMIIVEAAGYGRYGREQHRLTLDVLCAINTVAATHQVSRYVVGEWLAAEANAAGLQPAEVVHQFAHAYVGAYDSEHDYTRHRMAQLGWATALRAADIPGRYLDVAAVNRDWFHRDVRTIASGTPGRIEVFRRLPPPPAANVYPSASAISPALHDRRPHQHYDEGRTA